MRKKSTVIGACSFALAAVIAGVSVFWGSEASDKAVDKNMTEQATDVIVEEQTATAMGVTNISDVGASSVINTVNNADSSKVTGDINYYNIGFADVLETYHEYIYADGTSTEEIHEYIKQLDLATQVVPEGSIIDGYTNLGISSATTYLNVRKGPGTSNKIIGKMPGYSVCEILEEKDGWYKIKSGVVTGYVSADYILTGYDANVMAKEKMTEMLVVNCDKLNVREEPSTECSIATKVSKGEKLQIVEPEKDGWYKAEINNLVGYVSAEFVDVVYTLPTAIEIKEVVVNTGSNGSGSSGGSYTNNDTSVSQTVVDLINYAYQFLGNPYVYGGNSLTGGIDCSGFVKQIYAKFGYSLPRISHQYANVGTSIPLNQIKPGDILVYKYSNGGGHVAIYIGNGKIIHAANSQDDICIGNYNFVTPYKAVRIIN